MTSEPQGEVSERAWKHRFAQTLYEFFYLGGLDRAAALADAYAHADAQYLVRGLESPEIEARSALTWIRPAEARPSVEMPSVETPSLAPAKHISAHDEAAAHAGNGAQHAVAAPEVDPDE